MSPELLKALLILGVGMLTVFTILGLVVLSGEILIRIINRFYPAAVAKTSNLSRISSLSSDSSSATTSGTSPNHIAAIVAYVDHLTEGKGIIDSIKKIGESPK